MVNFEGNYNILRGFQQWNIITFLGFSFDFKSSQAMTNIRFSIRWDSGLKLIRKLLK